MKIPERCKECRSRGVYPCNDCIFTGNVSEEIAALFEILKDNIKNQDIVAVESNEDT